ncbi:MAG: hypothetical protein QM733_15685 [Ilumatobacteraceae bacterium]
MAKAIHDELVRRTLGEANELLRDSLVDAVKLLRTIINDDDADMSVRLKAAGMVMDRVLPKTPIAIDVAVVKKGWEIALEAAIVPVSDVIDTDAVDDDENPFD